MPPSALDLSDYREQIEKRILIDHHTQQQVVNWLNIQGVPVTARILTARCKSWGLSHRGAETDPAMMEQVYDRFHKTMEDDSTIATKLGAQGLLITARQVKRLRLKHD